MDTTIRNLDEQTYRALRACAVMQGRNVGDLLNEAIRDYLARISISPGRSTLRALQPESFPEGNEHRIAACYRKVGAAEFAQIKQAYPDEILLRQALEQLQKAGGVAPEMDLGFFLLALKKFS